MAFVVLKLRLRATARSFHAPSIAVSLASLAALSLLAGCGSASAPPVITPLAITTTSLPDGQTGTAYSSTLTATGGTPPYSWALGAGALPAGLTFNAVTGSISGTPTATASAAPLAFTVTDASTPVQVLSTTLKLTIAKAPVPVAISPAAAALVTGQALSFSATTIGGASVQWTLTGTGCSGSACGTLSAASSASGAVLVYTAPAKPGVYTLTATSSADSTKSGTAMIGVTDLSAMATWHNNLSRDGANTQEYALTPATVTAATFGKLFSCKVDGAIYGQPLWIPRLSIGGTKHNVVFVATQHDSLYAFDADTAPCVKLWQANLIDAAHGGTPGETAVPSAGPAGLVGRGFGDISPEVGILGTPVIDPATGTLYAVTKSVVTAGPTFYQRLHAIDVKTGNEKLAGPVTIQATSPGTGDGGTTVAFNPRMQNQRCGLALVNGVLYIAWASHEDTWPYYGWVMGYRASDLQQVAVFNASPNVGFGGIWMGGAAPSSDAANHLYLITGNATFDADSSTPPNNDYGDALLKLTPSLAVAEYFSPSDQASDAMNDTDFGSGGTAVLVDLPVNGTNPTHLLIGGGKDGGLYLLNRDKLGGSGDANAWQLVTLGSSSFGTGAFWNSTFYLAGVGGPMTAFTLKATTAKLSPAPTSTSSARFGFPGSTPSISATGSSNGILWSLDNSQYCTTQSPGCGPAVLHAWDATNLGNELWNSTEGVGNTAGLAVKFTSPTIANGRVYVGTRGDNAGGDEGSTSTPGELDVYGLLPN